MWLGGYLHNLTCMIMRVCGWVHVCVCFFKKKKICVLQNPQTFFFFFKKNNKFCHYKIFTTKTERLSHQIRKHYICIMYRRSPTPIFLGGFRFSVELGSIFSCDSFISVFTALQPLHLSGTIIMRKWWKQMEIISSGCYSPLILQTKTNENNHALSSGIRWNETKLTAFHCPFQPLVGVRLAQAGLNLMIQSSEIFIMTVRFPWMYCT